MPGVRVPVAATTHAGMATKAISHPQETHMNSRNGRGTFALALSARSRLPL